MGTIAAAQGEGQSENIALSLDIARHRLAAVAGTSSCYLVASPEGISVPGVWGPYRDVLFPGWWMNEGGQSSTGQVHVLVSAYMRFNAYRFYHLAHRFHDYDAPCL